jgi:hypothetical protein
MMIVARMNIAKTIIASVGLLSIILSIQLAESAIPAIRHRWMIIAMKPLIFKPL